MEQDQLKELNARIRSLQLVVARAHQNIVYCVAFSTLAGVLSVIVAWRSSDWPNWAMAVGLFVFIGATNLLAARQFEKDHPDSGV